MINILLCPCIVQPIIILIHKLLDVVKIAVPIGLVVFGLIDFGKATIAGDENAIKKSQGLFIKRLISGVAVFLVFMIVDFIVTLLASKGVDTADSGWLSCWNAEPGDKCEELLGESGGSSKTCGAGCPIGYRCYQGDCKTDDEIKSIEDSQKSSQDKCNESPGNWSVGSKYCVCKENAERDSSNANVCKCKDGYYFAEDSKQCFKGSLVENCTQSGGNWDYDTCNCGNKILQDDKCVCKTDWSDASSLGVDFKNKCYQKPSFSCPTYLWLKIYYDEMFDACLTDITDSSSHTCATNWSLVTKDDRVYCTIAPTSISCPNGGSVQEISGKSYCID